MGIDESNFMSNISKLGLGPINHFWLIIGARIHNRLIYKCSILKPSVCVFLATFYLCKQEKGPVNNPPSNEKGPKIMCGH